MKVPINFFRISKPADTKVPPHKVQSTYIKLRNNTFYGVTIAYSLYYLCRMALSVVKQPLIDNQVLSAGQLGLMGSTLAFVYAFGKFANGFIADYCNVRRFMGVGMVLTAIINIAIGLLGLCGTWFSLSSSIMCIAFAVLWGANGWVQSMGAPPGVISLSRWFPLSKRGTFFSIFCSTPYFGKFISMVIIGFVVAKMGWEYGFIIAGIAGMIGAISIYLLVSDTPESKGLPSVQELCNEQVAKADKVHTKFLQKAVLLHPGIWIIALSSAFVYITQYGLSSWGVLFLQKAKGFSLLDASWIIGFAEFFGIAGTIASGWLSDKVFNGDRVKPVVLSGVASMVLLGIFLFTKGSAVVNVVYVGAFSLVIGILYCTVGGLMALDIVPRKATGAALGVVGISSYVAVGLQDIISGYLIEGHQISDVVGDTSFNFMPVAVFWVGSCLFSFILPVFYWKALKKPIEAK